MDNFKLLSLNNLYIDIFFDEYIKGEWMEEN